MSGLALLGLVAVQGCTTSRLHWPKAPQAERVDFYPVPTPLVTCQSREFVAQDGKRLSYDAYQSKAASRTALVYLHGIESHGAWFEGPASLLAAQGYDVFCLDRRGSGRNQAAKGLVSGDAKSYRQLLSDVHEFLKTIQNRYERIFLVGSSWGGKQALAYTLAYPNQTVVDGLILITPGLRAKVDLPTHKKLAVLTALMVAPETHFDIPIPTEYFTTNPQSLQLISRDPLRLHEASARFLFASLRLDWFIDDHMGRNRLPILLVLAGQDRVINNDGVLKVLNKGRRELLDVAHYEDQTHAVQLDAPQRLADDINRWAKKISKTTRSHS